MLRIALTEVPVYPLAVLYKFTHELYTDAFIKPGVITQLQHPCRDKQTENAYTDEDITPKQAAILHPKTHHWYKAQDGPEEVDGLVHVMDVNHVIALGKKQSQNIPINMPIGDCFVPRNDASVKVA